MINLVYHFIVNKVIIKILPAGTSITYPGIYILSPSLSLCSCKQRLVQVQTNLVEPWQVGDKRLPLLHEMIPLGNFRETLRKEREHIVYLPLRTKIFQTIYLRSGYGQTRAFLDGIGSIVLHFRRRSTGPTVFTWC